MTLQHRPRLGSRILLGLLVVAIATSFIASPVAAQTPEAHGTPETRAFRLLARVKSDEWAGLAMSQATPAAGEALAGAELLAALRSGGLVIFFRHADTDFSQLDSDPIDLSDCATQRNLSEEGRAQSRQIGEAIAALGIPIGEVLSSELCRCRETAELAFGRATLTPDLSSLRTTATEAEEQERIEALRRLLATPPEPGTNTVLVSHLFNIQGATGISLDEGEAAIFLPLETPAGTATPSRRPSASGSG
mgnify:CR=1 FL=1